MGQDGVDDLCHLITGQPVVFLFLKACMSFIGVINRDHEPAPKKL